MAELDRWSQRSAFAGDDQLVFGHPQTGKPLDRSKVTRYFQNASRAAGVRVLALPRPARTFGTQMAAASVPIRTIQEWLGHGDIKTTQVYAHYAPWAHEVALVNAVVRTAPATGNKPSETQSNSEAEDLVNTGG